MADARHPNEEDPRDEGRLADHVSAGMWTTAGLVGAAMFALPGSTHEHLGASPTSSRRGWPGRWWRCSPPSSPRRRLRPGGDRAGLSGAGARVRRGHRRRAGGHAAAQAPLAARRGAPARDGPARPADRALQPSQLRRALEHALGRSDGVALVLFDFDGFKHINDEYGHPVGDAVRAVGAACDAVVRDGDCLARIGGDELAVVAPGARSSGVARIVASLEEAIAGPDFPDDIPAVRASFAWAVAPEDAGDGAALLDRADQRLLYGKRLNKV